MPAINKPVDGFDRPTDGYDPLTLYQMVPLGESREMAVNTNDVKAELSFTVPDICRMSNFRVVRQSTASLFPLPGPGVSVNRIALPENSTVAFTLEGIGIGKTVLRGLDRVPAGGRPTLRDFSLRVSVKGPKRHLYAVCYVFDRINIDTGRRLDLPGIFRVMNEIYKQANTTMSSIDNGRTLELDGSFGRFFRLGDTQLVSRLIAAFEARHPQIFDIVKTVIFAFPVPLGVINRRTGSVVDSENIGIGRAVRRARDGRIFDTAFLSSIIHDNLENAPDTVAHEVGHRLGLRHEPDLRGEVRLRDFPGFDPRDPRPFRFTPASMHNLMFPIDIMGSRRLNGEQIETLHEDLAGTPDQEFIEI